MKIRKAHTNDEDTVNMHNFGSFFLNNANRSNRLLLTNWKEQQKKKNDAIIVDTVINAYNVCSF